MHYNYYPPKKPQFFFDAEHFNQLSRYYKPYSLKSKFFWFFFKRVYFLRNRFTINEESIELPITKIKNIINQKNSFLFINLGTAGVEQKATVIAVNKNHKTFLKFAQTSISRGLVENEVKTLINLKNTPVRTPKLLDYRHDENCSFILTEVLDEKKTNRISLNNELLELIIDINNCFPIKRDDCVFAFAHGDFCPWNIMETINKKFLLVDWEKAGYKPLGYDLFSFIFQTRFILNPSIKAHYIIQKSSPHIKKYFTKYKIKDWKPYLIIFANIKITEEKNKIQPNFLDKYLEILSTYGKD